jgi:hypothetical protein
MYVNYTDAKFEFETRRLVSTVLNGMLHARR